MATPDALLIDALTQLPEYGGYESAGAGLYPELYPADPSLAPMPSFDGAIGRRSMGDAYGELLGGMELLGGPIMKPGGDGQRGELDVAAAAGGAPSLDPSKILQETVTRPPVDLSKIPSDIPLLAPGPSYPGVSAGPAPVPGGLLPPITRPPDLPFPSYDRGDAGNLIPRPRPTDIPSPSYDRGDAGGLIAPYVPPQETQAKYIKPGASVGRGVVDPPGAITDRTAEETANIETSANNAKDFLQGIGYFDDGPFGFAQSLMLMYGGGLEPTVTQGPTVPYRERGQPMTTNRYLNFATGGASVPSLLPEGQRLGQVAPSGDVATAEDVDDKITTRPGGLGFEADKIAAYNNDKSFDIIGSSLFPASTGRTPDGGYYFKNEKDFKEWETGVKFGPSIENASKYNYNIFDADGKLIGIRNKVADAWQDLTNFVQSGFDWLGDPSKTKGENATFRSVEKSYEGFINEATQFWQTNPNNLWGRKLFKPGETQDYGSLQPYAIMASILNPPQALVTFANTLIHDLFYAAKNTFSENPNYAGNPIQDIFNGAFHLFGRGIKAIGKNVKKLFTGKKATEGAVEGETTTELEGEDAFMKQLFREQKDNALRILWDEHKINNTLTSTITEAFLQAGVPVVLYKDRMKLADAIAGRKKDEALKIYNDIIRDLGGTPTGPSGDMFNLQTYIRDYDPDEGWKWFLNELENQHRKAGQD